MVHHTNAMTAANEPIKSGADSPLSRRLRNPSVAEDLPEAAGPDEFVVVVAVIVSHRNLGALWPLTWSWFGKREIADAGASGVTDGDVEVNEQQVVLRIEPLLTDP